MKNYDVTLKIRIKANDDEDIVSKTNFLKMKLYRELAYECDVESVQEFKKFSLFDRSVDYHRLTNKMIKNK